MLILLTDADNRAPVAISTQAISYAEIDIVADGTRTTAITLLDATVVHVVEAIETVIAKANVQP